MFTMHKTGTYLELAVRRYPLYPLCLIGAASGTMFIGSISALISRSAVLSLPLRYLGAHSMNMLFIHCFDGYLWRFFELTDNGNLNALIRVFLNIAIFAVYRLSVWFFNTIKRKYIDKTN